jgi:hypothetical protein
MISASEAKVQAKNRALEELARIRKVLRRELISYKIAQVGNGIDAPILPDSPSPEKPPQEPDVLADLPSLFSLIKSKIKNKKDYNEATGFWSAGNLLGFTVDQRTTICKALIEASKEIGIKPKSVWIHVVQNPDFWENWADEVFGSSVGSLTADLDEAI